MSKIISLVGEGSVVRLRMGSIILTVRLSSYAARRLIQYWADGELFDVGVVDIHLGRELSSEPDEDRVRISYRELFASVMRGFAITMQEAEDILQEWIVASLGRPVKAGSSGDLVATFRHHF
jgi:hypothetical protein